MTAPLPEVPDVLAAHRDAIRGFCLRWRLVRLAVFGSVLRDDFRPDSDIDVLVERSDETPRGFDQRRKMTGELEQMLGRSVDLVYLSGLVNPYMRREILSTARTLYAA